MKKFQFNKTAMIQIGKDLKLRRSALPILEVKEAALRLEIKKLATKIEKMEKELADKINRYSSMTSLWPEIPDVINVNRIVMTRRLVAGIQVPVIKSVVFKDINISAFSHPSWVIGGIEILKGMITRNIHIYINKTVLSEMEAVRRKTTQKVNLYKKVQIPEFEEAIRKIKGFLEDEENLSKSSQKILKNRIAAAAAL